MSAPVNVSAAQIIFGSMRMHEYDYPESHWVSLFETLYESGVRLFHSSSEYESFDLYRSVLQEFRHLNPSAQIKHVVKLAAPHFHEFAFDAQDLFDKVDAYLEALQTNQLYCVQWMWRGDLKDHKARRDGFERDYAALSKAVAQLKASGKIAQFHCFPYDVDFAEAALTKDAIDGLIVYRNPLETEFDAQLEKAANLGKTNYVIRPLLAGKALAEEGQTPASLLRFALSGPGVSGAVVSISSEQKFRQLL